MLHRSKEQLQKMGFNFNDEPTEAGNFVEKPTFANFRNNTHTATISVLSFHFYNNWDALRESERNKEIHQEGAKNVLLSLCAFQLLNDNKKDSDGKSAFTLRENWRFLNSS